MKLIPNVRIIFASLLLAAFSLLNAQVTLRADGPGNTYEQINAAFAPGYEAVENPECVHPQFGRHIVEVWDNQLGQYVFEFYSHVAIDNDRCINFDRQRVEIKTYEPSPNHLKGTCGESITYKWRFRVPPGFQTSSSFTHIHQIKAVGGDDDMPIFTFTARKSSPNRIEIIHNNNTKVATADLSLFEGNWVEATETILVDSLHGKYQLLIKNVATGATIIEYSNNDLMTIRYNNTFIRPKWGIYRSLLNSQDLRDETLRFNDFSIKENTTTGMENPTNQQNNFIIQVDSFAHQITINSINMESNNRWANVLDSNGKLILSNQLTDQQQVIHLKKLPKGSYILQLNSNRKTEEKKFILL